MATASDPRRRRGPTLAQLRALVVVAEHGHFRVAAAAMGVSQPGLSAAVASLEARLGVRLLERTPRGVLLTAAGERIVGQARDILERVTVLEDSATTTGSLRSGPFRIGVIPTVAPYLLPVVLPSLQEAQPALRPHISEEQTDRLVDGLTSGRLDVGILALPGTAPGLVELPLYVEEFVLAVPSDHPLAGRRGLEREVLQNVDVLVLDEGHCLRDQSLDVCREVGARASGDTHVASLATAVRLVAAGLGATLLPETALAVDAMQVDVGVARFARPPARTVGIAYRASSPHRAVYGRLASTWRAAVRTRGMAATPTGGLVEPLTGTAQRSGIPAR